MGVKQPGSEAEKMSSLSSESLGVCKGNGMTERRSCPSTCVSSCLWWQNLVVLYIPGEAVRWVKVTAVLSI